MELVLVIHPFAVKSTTGVQKLSPGQIVQVPREKMNELDMKGLVCPLLFNLNPLQVCSYHYVPHRFN